MEGEKKVAKVQWKFKFNKKFNLGIFWVPFSSEMDKSMLVEVGNDGDGSPMYIAR